MTVAPPSYRWERIVSEADPHHGYSPRPADPERLTLEELRALKARWYAEAEALGELDYLDTLGRTLGRSVHAAYFHTEWEREDPEAGRVAVFVDGKGGYLTVSVNGQRVCSTHPTERVFVPGPWLRATRGAAAEVAQERERREQEQTAEATGRMREQLGLTPPPPAADALADRTAEPEHQPARPGLYSALARSGR